MEDLSLCSVSQFDEQNNEVNLINLEDLHDDTVLPQQLIDLLNKKSFNGTVVEETEANQDISIDNNSCNASVTSSDSLNCDTNNNLASGTNKSNTTSLSSLASEKLTNNQENDTVINDESYDQFDSELKPKLQSNSTIKRTHLINLIYELYDLTNSNDVTDQKEDSFQIPKILVEGYMEKLPPGKNLKNSILLAWKRRYFKLNSIGELYIYDIDTKSGLLKERPDEIFNLMGGKAEFDQNKIISLDNGRGNYMVFRPCSDNENSDDVFLKWRQEIEQQIVDRSESLWVKPNRPLTLNTNSSVKDRNVLIVDIGTCSIRAGLYEQEPKLPKLFVPTVCSKDVSQHDFKVGFDAFDFLLGSSAPSTIDLRKSISCWSLTSSNGQLIFPLKSKNVIDKLNVELECIESIISYVVENLNIASENSEIVIITSHKLTDRLNSQYLNFLLSGEKFSFKSATLINQSLMSLYSYNANIGVIANLGEKIDIVPICNGIPFQNGVTNLAYGGSCMSEFLNYYISRGNVSYVNDIEQFFVRYVKEKSCYTAMNYENESNKYPNDSKKFNLEMTGRSNEFKKIEFPESARFRSVEGLFNPEIWGLDGQGIHKLIHKAIQSSSMDLRREMARNIYLCGGMSQIPGLKERLEIELKKLLPVTLKVKVNCSEYSYHSAYLGAFRFIQQPEYEKLMITRDEWSREGASCLKKWRCI